jgi:hypothetical protein
MELIMNNTNKSRSTGKGDTKTQATQGVAEHAATEVRNFADKTRDTAADEVRGVASALRTAADELRDGSPQERTFSQIADGLADASDALRNKDLGEIAGSVNDFARRNPLMFLGGAALVGFAATRFAKSSADHHHRASAGTRYNSGHDARQHKGEPT